MNNGNMNNNAPPNLSPLPGPRQPMLPPHMFMAPSPGFMPPNPMFAPNMFGFGMPKQGMSSSGQHIFQSPAKTVSDAPKLPPFGVKLDQKSSKLTVNEKYIPVSSPEGQREIPLFQPKSFVDEEATITLYKSEPTYCNGNLITANANYLCYVVKGTMIRVLSLSSKVRGLLKEQKGTIRDLQFAPNRDVLCSVDSDGEICIYDLTVSPPRPPKEGEVLSTVLAKWKGAASSAARALWDSSKFWVYVAYNKDKTVQIWDLSGVSKGLQEPQQLLTTIHCADEITDISVCEYVPQEPQKSAETLHRLIAVSSGSKVTLWTVESSSQNFQSSQLDSFIPFQLEPNNITNSETADEVVQSVQSVQLVTASNGEKFPSLIVGLHRNIVLKTFSLALSWGVANISCQSSFEFHGGKHGFANHFYVSPSQSLVFVSNMFSNIIYVLHHQSLTFDYVWGITTGDTNICASLIPGRTDTMMSLYCLQLNTVALYQLPNSDFSVVSGSTATPALITTPAPSLPPGIVVPLSVAVPPASPTSTLKQLLSVPANPAPSSAAPTVVSPPTVTPVVAPQEPDTQKTPNVMEILHRAILKRSMEAANSPLLSLVAPQQSQESASPTPETVPEAKPTEPIIPEGKVVSVEALEATLTTTGETSEPAAPAPSVSAEVQPPSDDETLSVPLQLEKKSPPKSQQPQISPQKGAEKKKESKKPKAPKDATPSTKKEVNTTVGTNVSASSVEALLSAEDPLLPSGNSNSKKKKKKEEKNKNENSSASDSQATFQPAPSSNQLSSNSNDPNSAQTMMTPSSFPLLPSPNGAPLLPTVDTMIKTLPVPAPSMGSFEFMLQAHMEKLYQRLETERKEREKAERSKQEKLLMAISNTVNAQMASAVQNAVHTELYSAVAPALTKSLVQVIEANLIKPLQETMKKSIAQALNGEMADQVAKKQAAVIQKSVQDSFEKVFVPQVSSAVGVMFQQVSKSFDEGLNKRFDELQTKETSRLNTLSQQLQKTVNDAVSDLPSKMDDAKPKKTTSSSAPVANAMESNVNPAAPDVNELFAGIQKLLVKKNYEEAFSQTLNARNLELLTKVCSSLDAQTVLRSGAMSMALVLCLVQQLGFNLATETTLKLNWLTEALVTIDSKEKTVAQHGPKILSKLKQNLEKLGQTPTAVPPAASFNLKLALHLINSLLNANK